MPMGAALTSKANEEVPTEEVVVAQTFGPSEVFLSGSCSSHIRRYDLRVYESLTYVLN